MVLEKMGEMLRSTLAKVAKAVFVDDTLIQELVKDIQRALLSADVNVKLVLSLTEKIKTRMRTDTLLPGLTKREQLVKIVHDELVIFLGGRESLGTGETKTSKQQRIMLVGLFGNGKTTTCGKLAKYHSKRGKKVVLVGLDVHRPAAMEQLQQVGSAINIPVLTGNTGSDAVKLWSSHEKDLNKYDIVIVDTAGRDAISKDLIEELTNVAAAVQPTETILILNADIGQSAQQQAEAFHEAAGITGVIITKMDGTAKAGGALTACATTGARVRFIGVGEKVDDLEEFNPTRFVGRLLGMGDLETLLEKAKEAITEEDAKDVEQRLLKGEFTLIDLYTQMEAMSKMGSLGKIMEMIPGMGQIHLPKEALQTQEGKLKIWKFAMHSMTKAELEDPELIDSSRMERISKGSGVPVNDVRDLLKQYRQGKKMVKMLKGGSPEKLMKKLQQGGGLKKR